MVISVMAWLKKYTVIYIHMYQNVIKFHVIKSFYGLSKRIIYTFGSTGLVQPYLNFPFLGILYNPKGYKGAL